MANLQQGRRGMTGQTQQREPPPAPVGDIQKTIRDIGMWPQSLWWSMPPMPTDLEWVPDVDILERNGNFVIRADLPGVRPENVDLSAPLHARVEAYTY